MVFWRDLSQTGFIAETFNQAEAIYTSGVVATTDTLNNYLPQAKMGNNYVYVFYEPENIQNNKQYFGVTGITEINWDFEGVHGFTPLESYNIDKKIDDGLPLKGKVLTLDRFYTGGTAYITNGNQSVDPLSPSGKLNYSQLPMEGTCYHNNGNASNPTEYTVAEIAADNKNCSLSFEFR